MDARRKQKSKCLGREKKVVYGEWVLKHGGVKDTHHGKRALDVEIWIRKNKGSTQAKRKEKEISGHVRGRKRGQHPGEGTKHGKQTGPVSHTGSQQSGPEKKNSKCREKGKIKQKFSMYEGG